MIAQKNRKGLSFAAKLFIFLLVFVLAAGAFFAYLPGLLFVTGAELAGPPAAGFSEEFTAGLIDRAVGQNINIVLLGFDRSEARDKRYSIYRPDTIMVASINFRKAEVSLLSIPRDSYVQIHGTGIYDKINHSYMYGYNRTGEGEDPHRSGLKTTIMTIRDFLGGLPIHDYIIVDMDGTEAIIDSIGGIYYEVEGEVRCSCAKGGLLVEEGYQLLDGEKFMHYVRNRAGHQGGETGRIKRQQQIMIALLDQLKSPAGVTRIPALYRALNDNVRTELNLLRLGALGIAALRVDLSEIDTYVFSGRGQLSYQNGQNIWYLVIDEAERVNIIREVFGVDLAKRPQQSLPGPVTPEPEELQPEPEPEPTPEPEPDPDPEPEPEPEPDTDPEPDPETEIEPEDENAQDDDPEPDDGT